MRGTRTLEVHKLDGKVQRPEDVDGGRVRGRERTALSALPQTGA